MLSKLPGAHLISYSFRREQREILRKTLDELKAPSTRIWIFLSPQLFLSRYGFRPHVSGESGIRILNVLNRLLILNPESCGRQMRIFFIISCLTRSYKSKPSSLPWILYSRWHALLLIFLEESWVLVVNPDTWEIRVESGYVWAWEFFKPQRKICRFQNNWLRVDGAWVD